MKRKRDWGGLSKGAMGGYGKVRRRGIRSSKMSVKGWKLKMRILKGNMEEMDIIWKRGKRLHKLGRGSR